MPNLTNADILKGSAIEIWFNDGEPGSSDVCPMFATEHTFTMNVETIEISTKSHGDYPAVLPQRITWNMTSNNLLSKDVYSDYMKWAKGMKEVTVKFSKVSNYAAYEQPAEKGIVDTDKTAWTMGDVFAEGKAIIENLEVNASAGDNGTLSISLKGTSEIEWYGDETTPGQ